MESVVLQLAQGCITAYMLRALRPAVAVALVTGLLAGAGGSTPPAQADEPYVINAILSLTGSAAFLGQGEARTLEVAEAAVNKSGGIGGRPVHFAIADDQSSPQVAVQLLNGIAAKNASVVIGPSLTGTCRAVAPLLNTAILAYCLSPGVRPERGSYMYSSGFLVKDGLTVALRYLRARNLDRVAFLSSTDATGQDGEESFRASLLLPENKSIQFVDNEHFNPADISVAAQMVRIKQSGAQALIALTTGTQLGTALRGATEAGLNIPVFTSNGNMTLEQTKQYQGLFALDNLYYESTLMFARSALPRGPLRDAVESFYQMAEGAKLPAEIGPSLAWDPAMLIVAALRHLGADAGAPQIRAYLAGIHDYMGANGPYDFVKTPQRGLDDADGVVVRWDAGKSTWVPMSLPGGFTRGR